MAKMFRYIITLVFIGMISASAVAEDKVVENQGVIPVEINKGKMIKLDVPISSVAIADPNTADVQVVSPKLLFVRGKKVGETSIYAVDLNDNMVFSAVLEITHNLSKLNTAIKDVAPDANVVVRSVDGGLIMEGFAASSSEAEKISNVAAAFITDTEKMVNMIKTGGSDQVMLKVRIVEMQRNSLKSLGLNLQNIANGADFSWQLLQGEDILFHTADPTIFAFSTPGAHLSRGSGVDTNMMLRYKDWYGLLDALETNGLARTLAEPTLTTTTGKPASFLAGGQFPLPISSSASNTVTIQYQPFGVSLNFTPIVMSKNRISLTVAPEVSTLNFNNPIQIQDITYPILNTRKASAVVELGSGDSFMLAGLIQSDASQTINKFPGVGDLPVLGALFRSQQFQNNQTELVILVTPYLVKPVAESDKLQTPVDGYVPPSDFQRLLLGNIYQQEPLVSEAPSLPVLHGSGGFLLGD
jgi:pilus assembly protein CpaC